MSIRNLKNQSIRIPKCILTVEWKDLTKLANFEIIHELSISCPWLIASCYAQYRDWYLVALACSFMFFLTGLRQVHNAYHYALGLSRTATEWVMVVMSVAMLGSMHAVQINHLRHHRYCMEPEDVEAASAKMSWWQAIMVGPIFPFRLVFKAVAIGNRRIRGWIALELAANIIGIALVFGAFDCGFLKYHVMAMAIGQCLTSFFAVWTVHHDAEDSLAMSRTVRRKLFARVTYSMFFHMEHHLFPAVPTCHLATLASRIDVAGPRIQWRQVL